MFVPYLDRDLTGITLRQPVPPDLSSGAGGLAFGGIQAVEHQSLVVGSGLRSLTYIEIIAGHADQLRPLLGVPMPCCHRINL